MIKRVWFPILLLGACLCLWAAPALATEPGKARFALPAPRDYHWMEEDTSTGRMYVAMDSGIMAKEDSLIDRLLRITVARKNDMGSMRPPIVALYSDTAYAHTPNKLRRTIAKEQAGHFLAEYDSRTRVVRLYPALPGKRRKLGPVPFKTTGTPSPEILARFCGDFFRDNPVRTMALKDSAGNIGGYVYHHLAKDSPLIYVDCQGDQLAVFFISATEEQKRLEAPIIAALRKAFPVEEELACPGPH